LSHYGLTQTGRPPQVTIPCPFHDEAKPSCKVNLEKRAFHCFGCNAKGNVLDFVAKMEHLKNPGELPEAARKLAEICGIPLEEVSWPPPPSKTARSKATGGHSKPQDTREAPTSRKGAPEPQTSLCEPPAAPEGPINPPLTFRLKLDPTHPYLTERGVPPEVVETFGLGFCARGMMKGRICIPIHNEDGELVAYAGRWPGDSGWPAGEEKYKLPPGFRKSHVLFGLDRVSPGYEGSVLVEGFFSVFRLYAFRGVQGIALMGCSISDEQIELLARRTTHVTVLLDGDAAGRAARKEVVARLAERMSVYAPLLPEGASPDTLDEATLSQFI
jgi:DNA primase